MKRFRRSRVRRHGCRSRAARRARSLVVAPRERMVMPRVLPKKPPFKPEEMVVAWTTFAADDLPPPGVMKRGTKLRGDHPAVVGHNNYFVSADLPDNEIANDFTFMPESPQHEHEFIRILDQLPDDQLMEATADISIRYGGETIRK